MMDPHFKAMLDAQAKAAEGQAAPPLDALPPDMVRAGYRMQRQATDQNAPEGRLPGHEVDPRPDPR
ncbi:MAG: hypothetical protein V4759_18565 [Pseudomonadota bacterium]